ncbi:MAG TPA: hypothetical protein PKA13_21635 [Geminicoccaceae bacterium]|nr:hypothetical protein [Geminicoccus sp.]HMU52397.1 hypothetical protein [Geminicoccaceae bacterium]
MTSAADPSPAGVPALPTMSTEAELAYYYRLGRGWRGAGAVVEVGCWLGGGTVRLAAGIRDSGRPGRVVAIDRFVWQGELYERIHPAGLPAGADFEPLFRRLTAPLGELIEVRRGEVRGFVWDGPPIEILLVDAPKQVPDILGFVDGFGGSLMAGATLAFQDYLHPPAYALPAVLSLLGDALRVEDVVLDGHLAGFSVRRPLVLTAAQRAAADLAAWTPARAMRTFDELAARMPEGTAPRLRLSLAFFLHDLGDAAGAAGLARELARDPGLRWPVEQLAPTSVYWRYPPIFAAFGVAPAELTPDLLVKRSIIAWKGGDLEAAIEACRQALAIEPGHAAAAERLARLERRRRV